MRNNQSPVNIDRARGENGGNHIEGGIVGECYVIRKDSLEQCKAQNSSADIRQCEAATSRCSAPERPINTLLLSVQMNIKY